MRSVRITVKGIVQGVGFRPFIYQLAHRSGVSGWVLNSSEGVIIEVEGPDEAVHAFIKGIGEEAPPRSAIASIEVEQIDEQGYCGFVIKESVEKPGEFQLISPDIAICDDCLAELFDKNDRRYRYPFINCTNCGPRFTIIKDIPYDRPKTTMAKFKMCPNCQAEYDDPMDRRFHAQPNACPVCGPRVEYSSLVTRHSSLAEDAVKRAVSDLKDGKVVAVKGLGGFHLACNASDDAAVNTLRSRKHRFGKPLAVMVADIAGAERLCFVNDQERDLLISPQRPIVLLKKRDDSSLAKGVAPDNEYLGIMLPYTPLHYILLKDSGLDLVMTSGNLSEEPIAAENEEAFRRLSHIADSFLIHDRDIYSRYDDPVVRVVDGRTVTVRRARSYAPYPVELPFTVDKEVLAVGGELKSTFCLLKDRYAFISQHIGDLENAETFEHYENTLELYKRLFRVNPELVAYDLHPEYLSTKFAMQMNDVPLVGIQHHHAHIVSAMVEHGIDEEVIGVSFDGTGYGTDGTLWGGEFLIATLTDFERVMHLKTVRLPGGEVAIRKPYRTAFSYLYSFFGDSYAEKAPEFVSRLDPVEVEIMKKQVDTGLLSPETSSAGRLFDAVSSLIGVRDEIEFEGQAAIDLEMVADRDVDGEYELTIGEEIDTRPIFEGILADLDKGASQAVIAGKFHNTIAAMIAKACEVLRDSRGYETVVLSGGVFQNSLLVTKATARLKELGFNIVQHEKVPANDGGISLGQAVIAYMRGGGSRGNSHS